MSTLRALLGQARKTGDWALLADGIPFAKWVGIGVEVVNGELVTTMRYREGLIGNYSVPALHGGAIGGLLESAAVFALLHAAADVNVPRIINITVDYQRSGKAQDTFAAATITKLGRRVATVRAIAWQEHRAQPIALADAHFLVEEG
jgi:uncharacterized protein (TIGR00369 family)